MPLSEHEQRLLEEMERSLYHNEADHIATVGAPRGRPPYRSVVLGLLIAILGVAALVTGVWIQITIVGVVGFVAMFGGVLLAITPSKRSAPPLGAAQTGPGERKNAPHAGFMDKLNERWDKRQDGHS
ncbi:MAG: DUF3040 domain-containing protein [Microbacteriaceae bacterium]